MRQVLVRLALTELQGRTRSEHLQKLGKRCAGGVHVVMAEASHRSGPGLAEDRRRLLGLPDFVRFAALVLHVFFWRGCGEDNLLHATVLPICKLSLRQAQEQLLTMLPMLTLAAQNDGQSQSSKKAAACRFMGL